MMQTVYVVKSGKWFVCWNDQIEIFQLLNTPCFATRYVKQTQAERAAKKVQKKWTSFPAFVIELQEDGAPLSHKKSPTREARA